MDLGRVMFRLEALDRIAREKGSRARLGQQRRRHRRH
ncbi:NEL domain-containing protein [Bradyrhizobium sp. C-145]|nr:NEL domain-containing protein [Bradyrhizobium sp. C-145]